MLVQIQFKEILLWSTGFVLSTRSSSQKRRLQEGVRSTISNWPLFGFCNYYLSLGMIWWCVEVLWQECIENLLLYASDELIIYNKGVSILCFTFRISLFLSRDTLVNQLVQFNTFFELNGTILLPDCQIKTCLSSLNLECEWPLNE